MTAAAIATMATVEAATTTRPFYLVVPSRNRARYGQGLTTSPSSRRFGRHECRSSTPVDIPGPATYSQGTAHGRFQRAIHRGHVQAVEMAAPGRWVDCHSPPRVRKRSDG